MKMDDRKSERPVGHLRDNLPQKKILIVDDDKNFTQLLKIHL